MSELRWMADEIDNIHRDLSDDLDVDELGAMWKACRDLAACVSVLERELSVRAADLLADVDYDPKVGYTLPDGTIIHHRQTASEKWRGRSLLNHLSTPMIDPDTGEQIESIPLRVLVEIIPAVTPDATSSKWKTTGLRNLDVDPDMFRTREWAPARTYLGAKRT